MANTHLQRAFWEYTRAFPFVRYWTVIEPFDLIESGQINALFIYTNLVTEKCSSEYFIFAM